MLKARISAAVFLVALLPTAAVAQHNHGSEGQSGQPQMMGGEMDMQMMDGMMGGMMTSPSPTMILSQSGPLGLAPAQVRQLEALQAQSMAGREARMTEMHGIHQQMSEMLAGDPVDVDSYEALLRQMADQQVSMHLRALRLGQEALGLLTSEQRTSVRSGGEMGHSMMGSGGMGMGHP